MTDDFYSERTEASDVKTKIVSKYFGAWANVMKTITPRIAYIDLFCGPGRYLDGSESTPIIILKKIISDSVLKIKIKTLFNDENSDFIEALKSEIVNIPDIKTLGFQPTVLNLKIDDGIAAIIAKTFKVPSFAFVDPWGYKGLSVKLIQALTKDWGCDCTFFFNYNRINAALANPIFDGNMNAIFGAERADYLRSTLSSCSKEEREHLIINELAIVVSNNQQYFVIPFRFKKVNDKTSHYLIFVSKNRLGYNIMKEIMYNSSSEHDDGVANFSYIPAKTRQMEILFGYTLPLDGLGESLLKTYSGQTLSTLDIFDKHNVGTPFIKSNYKEALKRLENSNSIIVHPPVYRRKNKFPDNTIITFKK